MSQLCASGLLVLAFMSYVVTLGIDLGKTDRFAGVQKDELEVLELPEDDDDDGGFGRLLPILIATGINVNNTLALAALAALGALAALLPLLGLAGLIAGLLLSSHGGGGGGGGYGHGHSDSGYAGYRSFESLIADWQQYSLADWVSVAEETFRKFDPSDIECYKRTICEFHQNVKEFGPVAKKFVEIFSYLSYLKIFGIPDYLNEAVNQLLDAAAWGYSAHKDCGLIFPICNFSVKSIMHRMTSNNV